MAAFTSKATGDWNAAGQTTWNEAGVPVAGDIIIVQNTHVVTLAGIPACLTLSIDAGGEVTDATNNVGLTLTGTLVITGTLTCGDNTSVISGTTITGTGSLAINDCTLSFSGIIALDNITATVGGATIGASNVDLGPGGSLTLSAATVIDANFLLDGGELDFGPYRLAVFGNIIRTSGTDSADTGGGFDVSQDADVVWANSYSFIEWGILAGVTATVTGGVGGRKFIADATSSIVGGGNTLTIWNPNANNYLSLPVGVADNLNVLARIGDGRTNSYDIDTGGGTFSISPPGTFGTVTQSGDLYCSTCTLRPNGEGTTETFNMDGRLIATGIVTLGTVGNRSCILNLSDKMHSIGGLVDGAGTNLNNALDLASCHLECSGAFDGDNIAVTSNGANLHGGTIQDTTVTGLVHAWGVTDGGGNTNVAHESSIGPGANVGTGIGMAA